MKLDKHIGGKLLILSLELLNLFPSNLGSYLKTIKVNNTVNKHSVLVVFVSHKNLKAIKVFVNV